ncbi:MAG: ABC transporter permease [Kiritimatiellia bacterium]
MLTIWRRELASCFLSPVAYTVMIVFMALTGVVFLSAVFLNEGSMESAYTILAVSAAICMTLPISAVSMRMFAEEKRSGTLEVLMTAPVTESAVVLGKYAGAMSFLIVSLVPVLGYVLALEWLSPAMTLSASDPGALVGTCVIVLLLCAFLTSTGLVISLLTSHQAVAGIITLCAVWAMILAGWIVSVSPVGNMPWVDYISALEHLEIFSRGTVKLGPVVLYVSGTVFMLFAGIRVLESRRWQ